SCPYHGVRMWEPNEVTPRLFLIPAALVLLPLQPPRIAPVATHQLGSAPALAPPCAELPPLRLLQDSFEELRGRAEAPKRDGMLVVDVLRLGPCMSADPVTPALLGARGPGRRAGQDELGSDIVECVRHVLDERARPLQTTSASSSALDVDRWKFMRSLRLAAAAAAPLDRRVLCGRVAFSKSAQAASGPMCCKLCADDEVRERLGIRRGLRRQEAASYRYRMKMLFSSAKAKERSDKWSGAEASIDESAIGFAVHGVFGHAYRKVLEVRGQQAPKVRSRGGLAANVRDVTAVRPRVFLDALPICDVGPSDVGGGLHGGDDADGGGSRAQENAARRQRAGCWSEKFPLGLQILARSATQCLEGAADLNFPRHFVQRGQAEQAKAAGALARGSRDMTIREFPVQPIARGGGPSQAAAAVRRVTRSASIVEATLRDVEFSELRKYPDDIGVRAVDQYATAGGQRGGIAAHWAAVPLSGKMTRFEPSVDMREVVGAALGWASAQAKATSICAALEAQWVSTCSAALDSQGVKLGDPRRVYAQVVGERRVTPPKALRALGDRPRGPRRGQMAAAAVDAAAVELGAEAEAHWRMRKMHCPSLARSTAMALQGAVTTALPAVVGLTAWWWSCWRVAGRSTATPQSSAMAQAETVLTDMTVSLRFLQVATEGQTPFQPQPSPLHFHLSLVPPRRRPWPPTQRSGFMGAGSVFSQYSNFETVCPNRAHGRCIVRRTPNKNFDGPDGTARAGRPVGFLAGWLSLAHDAGSRADHKDKADLQDKLGPLAVREAQRGLVSLQGDGKDDGVEWALCKAAKGKHKVQLEDACTRCWLAAQAVSGDGDVGAIKGMCKVGEERAVASVTDASATLKRGLSTFATVAVPDVTEIAFDFARPAPDPSGCGSTGQLGGAANGGKLGPSRLAGKITMATNVLESAKQIYKTQGQDAVIRSLEGPVEGKGLFALAAELDGRQGQGLQTCAGFLEREKGEKPKSDDDGVQPVDLMNIGGDPDELLVGVAASMPPPSSAPKRTSTGDFRAPSKPISAGHTSGGSGGCTGETSSDGASSMYTGMDDGGDVVCAGLPQKWKDHVPLADVMAGTVDGRAVSRLLTKIKRLAANEITKSDAADLSVFEGLAQAAEGLRAEDLQAKSWDDALELVAQVVEDRDHHICRAISEGCESASVIGQILNACLLIFEGVGYLVSSDFVVEFSLGFVDVARVLGHIAQPAASATILDISEEIERFCQYEQLPAIKAAKDLLSKGHGECTWKDLSSAREKLAMWSAGMPAETKSMGADLKRAVVDKINEFVDTDWAKAPIPSMEELNMVSSLVTEANVAFPMDSEVNELQRKFAVVLQHADIVDRRGNLLSMRALLVPDWKQGDSVSEINFEQFDQVVTAIADACAHSEGVSLKEKAEVVAVACSLLKQRLAIKAIGEAAGVVKSEGGRGMMLALGSRAVQAMKTIELGQVEYLDLDARAEFESNVDWASGFSSQVGTEYVRDKKMALGTTCKELAIAQCGTLSGKPWSEEIVGQTTLIQLSDIMKKATKGMQWNALAGEASIAMKMTSEKNADLLRTALISEIKELRTKRTGGAKEGEALHPESHAPTQKFWRRPDERARKAQSARGEAKTWQAEAKTAWKGARSWKLGFLQAKVDLCENLVRDKVNVYFPFDIYNGGFDYSLQRASVTAKDTEAHFRKLEKNRECQAKKKLQSYFQQPRTKHLVATFRRAALEKVRAAVREATGRRPDARARKARSARGEAKTWQAEAKTAWKGARSWKLGFLQAKVDLCENLVRDKVNVYFPFDIYNEGFDYSLQRANMTGDLAQTHAQVEVPIPLYQGKDGVGYFLQHMITDSAIVHTPTQAKLSQPFLQRHDAACSFQRVNIAGAVASMTNATLHDQERVQCILFAKTSYTLSLRMWHLSMRSAIAVLSQLSCALVARGLLWKGKDITYAKRKYADAIFLIGFLLGDMAVGLYQAVEAEGRARSFNVDQPRAPDDFVSDNNMAGDFDEHGLVHVEAKWVATEECFEEVQGCQEHVHAIAAHDTHYDTDVHLMAALQPDVYVADYFTDSFADVASFVGVYSQSDGFLHLMPLTQGRMKAGSAALALADASAGGDGEVVVVVENGTTPAVTLFPPLLQRESGLPPVAVDAAAPAGSAPQWVCAGVPVVQLRIGADEDVVRVTSAAAYSPPPIPEGHTFHWRDVGGHVVGAVSLEPGSYAVVKGLGEQLFITILTSPCPMGRAAGHAGLACEEAVALAGEIRLGAGGVVESWNIVSGTYQIPHSHAAQSGMPLGLHWQFVDAADVCKLEDEVHCSQAGNQFTPDENKVNVSGRCFLEGPSLEPFLEGQEARYAYVRYFMPPRRMKHSRGVMLTSLINANDRIKEDTFAFVKRMANGGLQVPLCDTVPWDYVPGNQPNGSRPPAGPSAEERLVRADTFVSADAIDDAFVGCWDKSIDNLAFTYHENDVDAGTLTERVNIASLKAHALAGRDRRPDMLSKYIERCMKECVASGDYADLQVMHYRAFVSDYLQVDLSEAKKMISLIFGVGKPASDIPFAWSLAVDAAQAKDIVLGYGGFQHFRRKFGARRRPAATRLFYASSAREGKVMGVMRQRSGQQNWIVACSTFDELIVSTCALVFRVDEVFGDLQEDCGVKPTVAKASPVRPLLGELLLASGGAARGAELPPPVAPDVLGAYLCHSVQHLKQHSPQARPPCRGPRTVREFNEHWGHDSQREDQVLCLQECRGTIRDAVQAHSQLVCWQPYGGTVGHFMAAGVREEQVCILDSALGAIIRTSTSKLTSAASHIGGVVFFAVIEANVWSLPDMETASYYLQGCGPFESESGACDLVVRARQDALACPLLDSPALGNQQSMSARCSNDRKMPGILVDQEPSRISEEAARCPSSCDVELKNTCVAEALRGVGFAASRARSGPLWAAQDGNDMLRSLGFQVRLAPPSRVRGGGRFLVDDGNGRAYGLRIGDYTVASFRDGRPDLITSANAEQIIAGAETGRRKIFMITEFGGSPCGSEGASGAADGFGELSGYAVFAGDVQNVAGNHDIEIA
ncbi:unnamed protein product, partial [Prorocentrum cordatum]